jgi:tRNA A22 N-methylase
MCHVDMCMKNIYLLQDETLILEKIFFYIILVIGCVYVYKRMFCDV